MTPEETIERAVRFLSRSAKIWDSGHATYRALIRIQTQELVEDPDGRLVVEELPADGGGTIYAVFDDATPVIGMAENGDSDAHAALCMSAAMLMARETPLPPNLRAYIAQTLTKEFEKMPAASS